MQTIVDRFEERFIMSVSLEAVQKTRDVKRWFGPDGGIGRRARFRSVCRKVWRFESSSGHQKYKKRSALQAFFSSGFAFSQKRKPFRASCGDSKGFACKQIRGRACVTESFILGAGWSALAGCAVCRCLSMAVGVASIGMR